MEKTRAARLGVGASFVAHSDANSALTLGSKISGSIKRARSQKLENDDEELPGARGSADDNEDSKCSSIKRKPAVASLLVLNCGASKKKNKKKKKKKIEVTSGAAANNDPVILNTTQSRCLEASVAAIAGEHSQQFECSRESSGSGGATNDDLGSGLRGFNQSSRKRTKTRSKAKNLKKDKRPPEFRPGGEK
jgi:hypothetical protein